MTRTNLFNDELCSIKAHFYLYLTRSIEKNDSSSRELKIKGIENVCSQVQAQITKLYGENTLKAIIYFAISDKNVVSSCLHADYFLGTLFCWRFI